MIRKAQSLSEYTICVAVITLVIIAMQGYVRRGLQARYFEVASQSTARVTGSLDDTQYEPYYTTEDHTISQTKNIGFDIQEGGRQTSNIVEDGTTRSGTSIQGINCYDE